jgi:hypothetical protein
MYEIIDGQHRISTLLSFIKNQSSNQGISKLVTQQDKLLAKILSGTSDANIPFEKLCQLLINLGFDERIRGSHHILLKKTLKKF